MTIEFNKSIAERWLMELWSEGKLDAADHLLAADYVRHDPELPLKGPDAYKRFVGVFREAFEDLEFTNEHMVAEGEKVFIRWQAYATLKGGKTSEIAGTDLLRIVDGKIVESWPLFDGLGLMRRMGIFRFLLLARKIRQSQAGAR